MNIHTSRAHTEGGNAVALTLLGLAVAILAGVAVLYFIGKSTPQSVYTPPPADEEVFESEEDLSIDAREGWRTYVHEEFNFSFEYPSGWIVATGNLPTGEPVISVSPAVTTSTSTVFGVGDVASHVSIYPLGADFEAYLGETQASTVIVEVPQASARDYVFNTGRPWATKAVFEDFPSSWSSSGFLFARVIVEEEELLFMRGETEITRDEFSTTSGDIMIRSGFIDANIRRIEEEILRSFTFVDAHASSAEVTESGVLDELVIKSPEYGEIISNPLSVRGQIPASLNGSMSVRLEDADGEVLAEVPVVPLGEWSADEPNDFEVSLVFNARFATSGVLFFEYADSSRIGEGGNKVVPVVFDSE